MTDTPRLWDRRADETPKSYAAFLAYVALGTRRSVREAARQHCVKTASSGPKNTTVKHWLRWSARHKWVSRSLARDEWIARTSDDQIVSNVTACKLALTTRALDYLTANDGADFLRAARALSLHFPPGHNRPSSAGNAIPVEDGRADGTSSRERSTCTAAGCHGSRARPSQHPATPAAAPPTAGATPDEKSSSGPLS